MADRFTIDIDFSRVRAVSSDLPRRLRFRPVTVTGTVQFAPADLERLRADRARLRRHQRRALLLWLCLRRYRRMVAGN